MNKMRIAKYKIGQVVKHRLYPFRGVVFDIDPVFDNTEEWWQSIPAEVRPRKDQPFYHLFAENAETRIRRLCLRAEPAARHLRQADPPSAGRRSVRAGRQRRLSPAQQPVELIAQLAQNEKARPRAAPFACVIRRCRLISSARGAGLPAPPPPAAGLPASCAPLPPSSAALPAICAAAPRTPSDRSAGRHRPWRNRSSGSGRLIGVPCMLIACRVIVCPFFILAIMSSVTG